MSEDKHTPEIFKHYDNVVKQRDALLTALREISKGEGPYSINRLKHAENTVKSMIHIAETAIAQCKEQSDG